MSILHSLRCLGGLVITFAGIAHAATVDPPTIALGHPTTSIVVADYREAGPADRIVFERVRVVRSPVDVPALIDIARPDLREPLKVGKRYLLAYTVISRDKQRRMAARPRGAIFLSSPGLEPALWDFSPTNEAMLVWKIDDELTKTRSELPNLLRMLAKGDARQRSFAAAEIGYRPELLRSLSASEQKALAKFVAKDTGPDRARATLMTMAYSMADAGTSRQYWDSVAHKVLANSPVLTRDRDGHTELILATLAYVQVRGDRLDPRIHGRWLRSDDMSIIESAIAALQNNSAAIAQEQIKIALTGAELTPPGRELLEQYLDHSAAGKVR